MFLFKKYNFFSLLITFSLLGCKNSSTSNPEELKFSTTPLISKFKRAQTLQEFALFGTTLGFGNLRTDGNADFGLVLKSFTKEDLFQIELNDLMSTAFDKISVIGNSIEIPSNVTLPEQRERYILSINLNKPTYKIQFNSEDDPQIVLLHGQFPFSDVVQGFRNDEPLLKLANRFNILSYSEYSFNNPDPKANFKVDLVAGQKVHGSNFLAKAPQNVASDYSYVVVALDQKAKHYLANNLTVLAKNEIRNLKISSPSTYIFSGLIHESFVNAESKSMAKYKMSLQLQESSSWTSELLDFIENIKLTKDQLSYAMPSNKGHNELGIAYNIIEISPFGEETVLTQNTVLGAWAPTIDLSFLPSLKKPKHSYRIDLFFAAASHAQIARDYEDLFELAEYISRNSFRL